MIRWSIRSLQNNNNNLKNYTEASEIAEKNNIAKLYHLHNIQEESLG